MEYQIRNISLTPQGDMIYRMTGEILHPVGTRIVYISTEQDESKETIIVTYQSSDDPESESTIYPIDLQVVIPTWGKKVETKVTDLSGRVIDEDLYILE